MRCIQANKFTPCRERHIDFFLFCSLCNAKGSEIYREDCRLFSNSDNSTGLFPHALYGEGIFKKGFHSIKRFVGENF